MTPMFMFCCHNVKGCSIAGIFRCWSSKAGGIHDWVCSYFKNLKCFRTVTLKSFPENCS